MNHIRRMEEERESEKPVCLVLSLQLCKQYFIISTIYEFTVNGIN